MRERMKGSRVFQIRCQHQGRVYPASVKDDSICQKTRAGHPREESNSNKKKESGRDGPGKIRLSTTHTPFIINKEGEGVQYFQ